MKRKTLLIVMLVFALLLGLTACTKKAESISVFQAPTKTVYEIGDTLDLTGGIIEAVYSDGETETVSMTDKAVKVSGFDSSKPGILTLTFTYRKASCSGMVTVKGPDVQTVLTSISINTEPTKTNYFTSDTTVDLTGGKLSLNYNTGNPQVIDMTAQGVSVKPYSLAEVGAVAITLEYQGFQASFNVTVGTPVLTGIEIFKLPAKTVYETGDALSLAGGHITAIYSDGGNIQVAMSECEATYDFSTAGEKEVTLTYYGLTTSFTVTVKEREPFIPDWDYISDLMTTGVYEIEHFRNLGYDLPFLRFWFEAEQIYFEIYASENPEWINYFEVNYLSQYRDIEIHAYSYYYAYEALIFDDSQVKEFVWAASDLVYWFMIGDLNFSQNETHELILNWIDLYKALSRDQLGVYLYLMRDGIWAYAQITTWLYVEQLGLQIANAYMFMVQADLYLAYFERTGESIVMDIFYQHARSCIYAHDQLSPDDMAIFDSYFPEYFVIKDMIAAVDIPRPDGYDWDYVDYVMYSMSYFGEGSGASPDELLYLSYYFIYKDIALEIEESQNADFKEYFNVVYGMLIERQEFFFEYYFLVSLYPSLFRDKSDFVRYLADTARIYYENVGYDETFIERLDTILEMYDDLEQIHKYVLIKTIRSFGEWMGTMFTEGLCHFAGFTEEEAKLVGMIVQADAWLYGYWQCGEFPYYNNFKTIAGNVVSAYNALADSSNFDAKYGELYASFLDMYRSYVEPEDYNWSSLTATMNTLFMHVDRKDDVMFLYSFFLVESVVEEITGNPEWEKYLWAMYGERIEQYREYYREVFYEGMSALFQDEIGLAYMKAFGKASTSYVGDWQEPWKIAPFVLEIQNLLPQLSSIQKYIIFNDISRYTYFAPRIFSMYHGDYLDFSGAESSVYSYLHDADLNYNSWLFGGFTLFYNEFLAKMVACIERYEGIADTSLFDEYYLDLYTYWVGVYNNCVNPQPQFDFSVLEGLFTDIAGQTKPTSLWFYYYLEIVAELEDNMETEGWFTAFQTEFGPEFMALTIKYNQIVEAYPALLDNEQLNEFFLNHIHFIFIYYDNDTFRDMGYFSLFELVVELFFELDTDLIYILVNCIENFATDFSGATTTYYGSSASALPGAAPGMLYTVFANSYIYYYHWIETGDEDSLEKFIANMNIAKTRFSGCTQAQQDLFMGIYGEKYTFLLEAYADILAPAFIAIIRKEY